MKNKITPSESWLITGGCGFIGTSIIKQLLKNGKVKHIRILDNFSIGTKDDLKNICSFKFYSHSENKEEGVFLQEGDIKDSNICNIICKDIDCIIHLAANTGVPQSVENPRIDMYTNIIGTFNILEAAKINKVKRFVFASSGAPAGNILPPIHEEIAPHPVSPYGASKLAGEGYCSAYANSYGIRTIILRFSNVYGPLSGHKTSVVAKFIKNVLDGIPCQIYGDGSQTRDFIYIDDLVNAILKASDFNKGGEIFQIATGKEITVYEIADELRIIFKDLGYDMEVEFGDKQTGDVLRNYSDITKAANILQWKAETELKKGLRKTINFFLNKKLL